jgi:pimeloyl-ACP methyl ester carboxylesterase
MSGPGGADTVAPWPEGTEVLTRVPPESREASIAHGVWIRHVLAGAGNPFDEASELARSTRLHDRSCYPSGTGRQLVAVLAAKSRLERLADVKVPTLVIHGADDPLVPAENGRLVAQAVPGARLLEFEGMGHDIPKRFWPPILDAIAETAGNAKVPQRQAG